MVNRVPETDLYGKGLLEAEYRGQPVAITAFIPLHEVGERDLDWRVLRFLRLLGRRRERQAAFRIELGAARELEKIGRQRELPLLPLETGAVEHVGRGRDRRIKKTAFIGV